MTARDDEKCLDIFDRRETGEVLRSNELEAEGLVPCPVSRADCLLITRIELFREEKDGLVDMSRG